jgi:hypothetical protein
MNTKFKAAIAALGLLAAGAVASTASADTRWETNHPRQDQVFDRAAHERHDIRVERRDGELSGAQAHRLMTKDHRVMREDRLLARANGGHITKGEQHFLNRQENGVRRHVPG